MTWILAALGLVLLVAGGELLVRGASGIAARFGVSSLVIGLTVVAFGTSAPELVVSVTAAIEGRMELAVSNVVGSNIFNVLFILGVCAVVAPLVVASQIVRREIPIMIATSLLLWFLALDGHLGIADSLVLLAGIVAFTTFAIIDSRREVLAESRAKAAEGASATAATASPEKPKPGVLAASAMVALGLGLLVGGGRLLVTTAVEIATRLGVSETVVGLTIVAAGTSLPEVFASLIATFRGERDIAIGNVVGSNIFNILGILGVSGLVSGSGLDVAPAIGAFDLPIMVAVAVAALPLAATGHRIDRWEGVVFLLFYVVYVGFLVLAAQEHAALPAFSAIMLELVVPLVVLTFAVIGVRVLRERSAGARAA